MAARDMWKMTGDPEKDDRVVPTTKDDEESLPKDHEGIRRGLTNDNHKKMN